MSKCVRYTLIVVVSLVSGTRAGDEPAEFKDYTPAGKMIVERMLKAVSKLETYSDRAEFNNVMSEKFGRRAQKSPFAYARPNKFRIETAKEEVVSDGKKLTVYMKAMRRYTSDDVRKDAGEQVERFLGYRGLSFSVGQLILSKNPRKIFAENFERIDLAGDEKIDGERCLKLVGFTQSTAFGMGDMEVPVSIWIRKADHMIRRIEVDLMAAMKKLYGDRVGGNMPFKEFLIVYDVRDMEVNEELEESLFRFEPPNGAKKVKKFYTAMSGTGETAAQFELSGKPAPGFDLETADGGSISLDDLADNVVLLVLLPRWSGSNTPGLDELGEIQESYASKGVTVLLVFPKDSANDLATQMSDKEVDLTVALDPDGSVSSAYADGRNRNTIVVIGKGGIVQGLYTARMTVKLADVIRKDLDRLTAGKSLASAKIMTAEELDEASDQRAARYSSVESTDPVNEDDLRESWAVRADNTLGAMKQSTGSAKTAEGMWLRDRDVIKLVSPSGEITAEIESPNLTTGRHAPRQFVAGRFGRQLGVLFVKSGTGETAGSPREVMLTAADSSGTVLWELPLDAKSFRGGGKLVMADLDGRGGDEAILMHQGSIWIIDGATGDVLARKPVDGEVQWVLADDCDNDRVDELYLRTQNKLRRFDYRRSR